MKKLIFTIIAIIAIFTTGCIQNTTTHSPMVPDVTDPPPEIPITNNNIVVAWFDGINTKFFDGSGITTWDKTGTSYPAGWRKIAVHDKLYTLEQRGAITGSMNIITDYEFVFLDQYNNLWQLHNYLKAESGSPKDYKKVYLNNAIYGTYQDREYPATRFFEAGDDIVAYGPTGGYNHVNGTKTIAMSVENGFTVYNLDSTARTAKIDNIDITWTFNYFNQATQWLKSGSIWYSQNGYTWDGAVIGNETTPLKNFNRYADMPIVAPYGQTGVLIAAGTVIDGGETVLFFIECNSGYVFKYTPSTNVIENITRLYIGDGYRTTGNYYKNILKPVVASDGLYYCFDDGFIYRYRFDSGQIQVIAEGATWISGWE